MATAAELARWRRARNGVARLAASAAWPPRQSSLDGREEEDTTRRSLRAQQIPLLSSPHIALVQRCAEPSSVLGARAKLVDERNDDGAAQPVEEGGFCKNSVACLRQTTAVVRALMVFLVSCQDLSSLSEWSPKGPPESTDAFGLGLKRLGPFRIE